MNDRLLSLLGICRRAGKLAAGADPSVESIRKRRSRLILFADDFSKNSAAPGKAAVSEYNVKAITLNRSKDELSLAIGKLCGVVSVEDKGFADRLTVILENESGGELYG